MPDKSRRRRGKYSAQGKKGKSRPSHPTVLAGQPAVAQAHESVSLPKVAVAAVRTPTMPLKPATISYPYVSAELRSIGILTGMMLIILVVLALVLS